MFSNLQSSVFASLIYDFQLNPLIII